MALHLFGLQLGSAWKTVVRRAWSVRLIVLAAMLTGIEILLPLQPWISIPPGVFAILSFLVTVAAFVARLVVQKDVV